MLGPLPKYLLVVGASMAKMALGPITSYGLKLSLAEAVPLCAAGMMTTMLLAAAVGQPIRSAIVRLVKRPSTTDGDAESRPRVSPRVHAIWRRWGVPGLAFVTPLLLSPPGGAFAAVALAVPRRQMLLHMMWSAVLWSIVLNVAVYRLAGVLGIAVAP